VTAREKRSDSSGDESLAVRFCVCFSPRLAAAIGTPIMMFETSSIQVTILIASIFKGSVYRVHILSSWRVQPGRKCDVGMKH